MTKYIFRCLLLPLFLVACGGDKTPDTKSVEPTIEQKNASEIIHYTNLLIEYLNTTSAWMESNVEANRTMILFVKTGKKPTELLPLSKRVGFDSEKAWLLKAPSAICAEDKAYLEQTMRVYQTNFITMYKNSHKLHEYIKDEDYVNNGFAKARVMTDSIESRHRLISNQLKEIYDRVETVTDGAEEILLADSPVREPIMAMKTDLKNFKDMYANFGLYDRGEDSVERLEELYEALYISVRKHKNEHADLLGKFAIKANYDSYYDQCSKSLIACNNILSKVRVKGKISSEDKVQLSGDYDALVSLYNRFNN